jgi:ATP-dependent Clp protease ATP-binding subunit ClpA
VVNEEDIAQIVASWTGVPVNKLTESESEKLLHMEDTLHQRLIGQDEAVKAISRAIRRARVGLRTPTGPSPASCSPALPGWVKLNWPSPWRPTSSALKKP